jgi:3-deoxy-7-phosphoheptulonate synthase
MAVGMAVATIAETFRLMHPPTSDLRIRAQKPLIAPAVLEDELPLSDAGASLVARTRMEAAAILTGADDRLLVVVGPCSIHDSAAAIDYAGRLQAVVPLHARELLLVMRVYFEKPRTVVGWKGLINDPFLDGSFQINTGLRLARKLMLRVVHDGLPVATEFLDTTLGQYYADLVTWGAIGARTVESQVHRELASGLSMPVGFKNRTDGDVQVAIDAIRSARHPHWFPSLTREGAPAVMGTTGNEHAHLVLRGGSEGPNYAPGQIRAIAALLRANELPPHVMIDCSHANSGRDPARQPGIAAEIAAQIIAGERAIAAVMLESNLLGGAQDYQVRPLVYGRSITDPCLPWEQTLPVLASLAEAVRKRRGG